MSSSANVHLALQSEPANVSLVREMLSGLAESLAIGREQLDDIKTAVSEACNNVVLHAYEGERGSLVVEVVVHEDSLEVVVCDEGVGFRPRPLDDDRAPGVGLAVIQSLSDRVEFVGGGGTAVRMSFQAAPDDPVRDLEAVARVRTARADLPSGEIVVSVSPVDLAPLVFSRLVGALSARARFSIDRLSDAQLVTDALAGASDPVTLALSCEERRLDLRLGPLELGRGERVLGRQSSVENLLGKLVDEITTERIDGHEVLHLGLNDRR
ncbi:MAG: ATP-binding protein [Solirubrobacteraceae bacterium]